MSATRPVEGRGTGVVIQQNATQPVAGTATQPVEAPVAGPEVLLTSTGVQSDSDGDLHSEPGSPVYDNFQDSSPKISPEMRQLIRNSLEETSYRETSSNSPSNLPTDQAVVIQQLSIG